MGNNWLQTLQGKRAERHWASATDRVGDLKPDKLRRLRDEARGLRDQLTRFLATADDRLDSANAAKSNLPRPSGSDWVWRPSLWRHALDTPGMVAAPSQTPLGYDVKLFHDCKISELSLRQIRNFREKELAPFGLRMDVFRFDGSFLSLVIDLPDAAITGLTKNAIIRATCTVVMEKPLELFARLNVKHGPNTEQILREIPVETPQSPSEVMAEFDLAYSNLNEKRIDKVWLDLIFEGPDMNEVILRDLTFSRRPRANL